MRIVSFGCTGYKPFRGHIDIAMCPLTVFIGRNNSGKTAALRLPRLLLRALSAHRRSGFPLDVDDLTFGETFRDLVHQRFVHGHIDVSIALEDQGQQFAVEGTVQNIAESTPAPGVGAEYQVVSKFRLEHPAVRLEWDGKRGRPPSYKDAGQFEFRGLLPDARGDGRQQAALFEDWSQRIRDFEDGVSHLSAHRQPIRGSYERGTPRLISLDGGGAPEWLAESSELLETAGDWYERNMDGWRLSLDNAAGVFRCVLRRGGVEVNLSDAGDGMQQLLPVVVQQLLHACRDLPAFLDLVEEPELHLHPAAHAPLADLFLRTAASGKGQILVETHSENLLLRLRRRIAEGADPGLVAVYWIEDKADGSSAVRPIQILSDGEVDYWPEGVFSEGYQEVRALRRAARTHVDTTSAS